MILVLDPSVVIKWHVPEVLSAQAGGLKAWIVEKGHGVSVPDLFFAEAANILWKKSTLRGEMTPAEARSVLQAILAIPFAVVPARELLAPALKIADEHRISAYDALYLALASLTRTCFVTADEALAKKLSRAPLGRSVVLLAEWESILSN